jgi:predicted N-acetyltransferase YhbS
MVHEKPVINIRPEKPANIPLIYSVHEQTFKRDAEAKLAVKLRQACIDCLSLVAEDNGAIVGHIMFTPVSDSNQLPGSISRANGMVSLMRPL